MSQTWLNGGAITGYHFNPNGNTIGLFTLNLPAGNWAIGATYTGPLTTGLSNSGFYEMSAVTAPGESFIGNVPMAVSGNTGTWIAKGFSITGSPSLYIETEATGGKFVIMTPTQMQDFQRAYPNGIPGGSSYSYYGVYTAATEIEGQLSLPEGQWYLVWINDSGSWAGGAGNIIGFSGGGGSFTNTGSPPPPPPVSTTGDFTAQLLDINTNLGFGTVSTVAVPGGSVLLHLRLSNTFTTTKAPHVQVYLSTDPTITTSDTPTPGGGTILLNGIPAGGTDTGYYTLALPTNLAPGTYYVGGIVDFDNLTTETNESNNASNAMAITVQAPTTASGDFTAQLLDINTNLGIGTVSTIANPGGSVLLHLRLSNTFSTTKAPHVQVYLSTDPTITTADTPTPGGGTILLNGIPANGLDDGYYTLQLPTTLAAGTYYVGGIVDFDNLITESNESNNASNAMAITVRTPVSTTGDLTAQLLDIDTNMGIGFVSSTASAGGSVLMHLRLSNSFATTKAPHVQVYLSTDPTITTADTPTPGGGTVLLNGIPANGFDEGYYTLQLPTVLAAGTYYVGGIVDFDNLITETNESNNASNAMAITIRPVSTTGDLTVQLLDINTFLGNGGLSTATVAGGYVKLHYRLSSTFATSKPAVLQMYLSTDPTITTTDTPNVGSAGTTLLDSIPANGSLEGTSILALPTNLAPGTYYVGVVVDFQNTVTETNETNNSSNALAIQIQTPVLTNNHSYMLVKNVLPATTWVHARDEALAKGGYLATITSKAENDFILSRLAQGRIINGANAAFIGATDQGHEGVWTWANGPEAGTTMLSGGAVAVGQFANFAGGEPSNATNNTYGAENFAVFEGNGAWNDVPLSRTANQNDTYIAEFESTVVTLVGGAGADVILANGNNNVIQGGTGDDTVDGGTGNDTIDYSKSSGAQTVNLTTGTSSGADGADQLTSIENVIGSAFNDSITGDTGNNTIFGGFGSDTIDGGTGTDVAVMEFGRSAYRFTYTGAVLSLTNLVDGSVDTLTNIETLRFGTEADIVSTSLTQLVAASANGLLITQALNDVVTGGIANDTIFSQGGNDQVFGGAGNDVIILGDGNDFGDAGTNTGTDYLYGGNGDDVLNGGAGSVDVLLGEAGNDSIFGNGGSFNYIFGGAGTNFMKGGSTADIFISQGIGDQMIGGNGHNFYYIYGSGTSTVTGGSGIDEFAGGAANSNDQFNGGAGQDYAYGGNGNDTLDGGAGNDILVGEAGNDVLAGGSGVNLIWLGTGDNDQVVVNVEDGGTQTLVNFDAGGTNDTVRLLGSNLFSFADYQNLLSHIGTPVGGNVLYNAGTGAQLYLNLGPTQSAIWFQGVSPFALTAADFTFV